MPFLPLDLSTGVIAQVVQANAKGVKQADGVTPVSGDHIQHTDTRWNLELDNPYLWLDAAPL